jgi:MoaA/NifB/PqqE/SkfB family radical SAM enzyme
MPAKSAVVLTNLRCNQNCTYCVQRSATDARAFIERRAVEGRIDAALATGASTVVFGGGEPTMRIDLEGLAQYARRGGAEHVVLETNATLVDDARARALAAAGVSLARVNLAGWGEPLDAVTRDPGGFARTLLGMRALVKAGIAIEIVAAIVRSTSAGLAELPARLAEAGLAKAIRTFEIVVPVDAPDPTELVSYEAAREIVLAVDRAARAVAIPLRFHPAFRIPPCVFPQAERARVASLYALAPGAPALPGHVHVDACRACIVADRCSGFALAYTARRPLPAVEPLRDDKMRRRLTMVGSVHEQIARELVTPSLTRGADGAPLVDAIVRINFHCNQACTFCFVSTHLPPAAEDVVERAIVDAGRRGERVVLSGGEPTLNPRVVDYLRLAKANSRHEVSLQTNAIRLDDEGLVRALEKAGLDEAFVSLHGATAEVSDFVTQAPGTFVRTVAGLDNLAKTAIRVGINFVLCATNHHEIEDAVRLVAARWPKAYFNVSFVAPSSDLVPRERALIPRYSDVMPHLTNAVRAARERGVTLSGFESMCGLPLCLVPAELDSAALVDKPEGFDAGEFLKAETCKNCRYESRCWGLRRGYAALYGTDELHGVPA